MRYGEKGEMYTLDQDIFEIWEAHGWEIEEIVIPKNDMNPTTWIIKARPSKKVKEESK